MLSVDVRASSVLFLLRIIGKFLNIGESMKFFTVEVRRSVLKGCKCSRRSGGERDECSTLLHSDGREVPVFRNYFDERAGIERGELMISCRIPKMVSETMSGWHPFKSLGRLWHLFLIFRCAKGPGRGCRA
jgi:hypothetical protein